MTLLGQNVNSYRDLSVSSLPMMYSTDTNHSEGFSTIYRHKEGGRRFADLLYHVSKVSSLSICICLCRKQSLLGTLFQVDPEMRIRFTSPHPKDFPNEVGCCVLNVIAIIFLIYFSISLTSLALTLPLISLISLSLSLSLSLSAFKGDF